MTKHRTLDEILQRAADCVKELWGEIDQERALNRDLTARNADLVRVLAALMPPDFDDHPQYFKSEWHDARAALRKAGAE